MDQSTSSPPRKRVRDESSVPFDKCPRSVDVTEFVESRALEITQLLAVVDNSSLPAGEVAQGPRTFVQRLPRHLRRRAMSYNIKRLPRRLRQMAEATIKESKHRKKPPSRRWRRRPRNLLNAYVRRQRNVQWLETHIWHAKRFHMISHCGWRLPDRSCQKGFRATYRDATRHCTVQDLSFYVCFELEGPQSILVERLNSLCRPSVSQTFSNAKAISGVAEGRATLYEPGSYPRNCIGPVQFIYEPCTSKALTVEGERRRLWIWAHPAFDAQLLEVIIGIFRLAEHASSTSDQRQPSELSETFKDLSDFQASKIFSPPTYRSSDECGEIVLRILKHHLVKFRLIGPKSGLVLAQVLHQPKSYPANFTNGFSADLFKKQWNCWENISKLDAGLVQPGFILPLITSDPRLFTQYKKQLPNESTYDSLLLTNILPINGFSTGSPIWSDSIRRYALESKLSDAKFSGLGAANRRENISCIPAMIIQQPSSNCTTHIGFGSGWDLILPAGWAMPFWIALQYATARAVGLNFQRHFAIESTDLRSDFPRFWPDTTCGLKHQEMEADNLRNQYLKRPINKRVDYERFHITHPFACPWNYLIDGWMAATGNKTKQDDNVGYYVLRERIYLRKLEKVFQCSNTKSIDTLSNMIKEHPRALICVKLISIGKGIPKARALICLPTVDDLVKVRLRRSVNEHLTPPSKVVEESIEKPIDQSKITVSERDFISFDSNDEETTKLDLEKLFEDKKEKRRFERKLKEKERKKKKRQRDRILENENERIKVAEFENIIDSCDRRILGYVVDGDFAFSGGHGQAVGICSLLALKYHMEIHRREFQNCVLYRNVQSRNYHAAKLSLLNN